MEIDHISALLSPFLPGPLSQDQLREISSYLDLLLRWNARINLTAVREPENIVTRHCGESLFAAAHLFPNSGSPADASAARGGNPALDAPFAPPHVIDLGSGAGFPGLPIRIWAPHVRFTLIESNHKKVAFLREVCRTLGLMNVDVFAGRAQDFPSSADVVTLRAVERFESALTAAARLVSPAGRIALLIGSSQVPAASRFEMFSWQQPIPTPQSNERVLLTGVCQPVPPEPI